MSTAAKRSGFEWPDFDSLVRAVLAVAVVILGAWWFWEVSRRLGTPPVKDDKGNIVVDEYQRSKDILTVALPLVTTVIGYWFGAQGKKSAEEKADKATKQNMAISAAADSSVLTEARRIAPEAFGLPAAPAPGTTP